MESTLKKIELLDMDNSSLNVSLKGGKKRSKLMEKCLHLQYEPWGGPWALSFVML